MLAPHRLPQQGFCLIPTLFEGTLHDTIYKQKHKDEAYFLWNCRRHSHYDLGETLTLCSQEQFYCHPLGQVKLDLVYVLICIPSDGKDLTIAAGGA